MGSGSLARRAAWSAAGLAVFLALLRVAKRPTPAARPQRSPRRAALAPPPPSAAADPSRLFGPPSLVEPSDALGIERIVGQEEKDPPQKFLIDESRLRRLAKSNDMPLEGETAALLQDPQKGGESLAAPASRQFLREPESRDVVAEPDGSWSGSFSSEEAGWRVVSDEESWRRLWPNCSPDPLPPVDFSKDQVAAVFLGLRPSGGYKARIVEARPKLDHLLILWEEAVPPPGKTPPEGRTAPFALRRLPKTGLPVRFRKM